MYSINTKLLKKLVLQVAPQDKGKFKEMLISQNDQEMKAYVERIDGVSGTLRQFNIV